MNQETEKPKTLTYVRFRPQTEEQMKSRVVVTGGDGDSTVKIADPKTGAERQYMFNEVFMNESQNEIYRQVSPGIVDKVLDGYNCAVIAYGRSGSGKTYTMLGKTDENDRLDLSDENSLGLVYRLSYDLFKEAGERGNSKVKYAAYEIYNETTTNLWTGRKIRLYRGSKVLSEMFADAEDPSRLDLQVNGQPLLSMSNFKAFVEECHLRRKKEKTELNDRSSRSHLIIILNVITKKTGTGPSVLREGNLVLADLAGSELLDLGKAEQKTRESSKNINKSLFYLTRLVNSRLNNEVFSYDSELTKILGLCIGANCLTSFLICSYKIESFWKYILRDMDFALAVSNITYDARQNEVSNTYMKAERYRNIIQHLLSVLDGNVALDKSMLTQSIQIGHQALVEGMYSPVVDRDDNSSYLINLENLYAEKMTLQRDRDDLAAENYDLKEKIKRLKHKIVTIPKTDVTAQEALREAQRQVQQLQVKITLLETSNNALQVRLKTEQQRMEKMLVELGEHLATQSPPMGKTKGKKK